MKVVIWTIIGLYFYSLITLIWSASIQPSILTDGESVTGIFRYTHLPIAKLLVKLNTIDKLIIGGLVTLIITFIIQFAVTQNCQVKYNKP